MRQVLRVGFVVHVMQVAGAEVLVRELIRRLRNQIHPTIFCLDAIGRIGEELVQDGVEVICLNRRPGRDWGVSLRLAQAIDHRRIDVLHAHQYSPFFYSALAKVRGPHRPKLILSEHGRHYPDRVSPLRRAVNRLLLAPLADAITACSLFSARGLSRVDGFPGSRIRMIPNGIDVSRYGPTAFKTEARRRVGLSDSRRYLIHVARHHPVKDQATLLRGFAAAADRLPQVDLLMVGDGPLRPHLEALVHQLGLGPRVIFLGIRDDIPDLMRAADAFILTSLSEAASLTLLEAMASGLPAILTHVGGNPEIVRHEQEGLLFPRADWAGCAEAIQRIFLDNALARHCSLAARNRVLKHYRLESTVEAYHRLYRQLVGDQAPATEGPEHETFRENHGLGCRRTDL